MPNACNLYKSSLIFGEQEKGDSRQHFLWEQLHIRTLFQNGQLD